MGRKTVLEQYQRLEAEGIWRSDPDAQRLDVIVAIGEATLTLSDQNERVLTHWSLAALNRTNPGTRPAVYTPGADARDTLEIADPEMIDALEKVLKAIRKGRAHPGRLRVSMLIGFSVLVLLLLVLWMPGAVTRYAASILPDVAGDAIGEDVLVQMHRVAGPPCDQSAGLEALTVLKNRLIPDAEREIVILPSALTGTAHLPGGRILVDHRLVEDVDTPNVIANAVIAENARYEAGRPVEDMLAVLGVGSALRLLTTGVVSEAALAEYAAHLINQGTEAESVDTAPDDSGPVLSDGSWIALQQICEK